MRAAEWNDYQSQLWKHFEGSRCGQLTVKNEEKHKLSRDTLNV